LIAKPAGPGGSLSLMARDTLESTAAGGIVCVEQVSLFARLSCYPLTIKGALSMEGRVGRQVNLLLLVMAGVDEDASRGKGRGRRGQERTRRTRRPLVRSRVGDAVADRLWSWGECVLMMSAWDSAMCV
jgi:hypothetical protein